MCGLAFNCICTSSPPLHMQPQKNGACNVSVRLQLFPLLRFEQGVRKGGECWIENVYRLF